MYVYIWLLQGFCNLLVESSMLLHLTEMRNDIHQKSVIHYFVVGVSVSYLAPAVSACAAVVPPVAEYLSILRKS